MAGIDTITGFIPGVANVSALTGFIVQLFIGLLVVGVGFFIFWRIIKYNIPVEIWRFSPALQIYTDRATMTKKDGIQKIRLLKNKKKQIDNFVRYPVKKGRKVVNKIYLTEENGAYRSLHLNSMYNFFTVEGQLIDGNQVFYDNDNTLEPLSNAELFTKDNQEVFLHPVPALSPTNNDSQNAFQLEVLDANAKYHVPSWFEKIQVFAVVIAGIMSAVIFLIMTRAR